MVSPGQWLYFCASTCVVRIVAGQARCLNAKPLSKLLTCRTKCSSMLWTVQHLRIQSTKISWYVITVKLCAWLVGCLVGSLVVNFRTLIHCFFFQDIARYIKEEFNKKYDRRWHCIVGPPAYVCSVSHDSQRYICFHMCDDDIVLFKCG